MAVVVEELRGRGGTDKALARKYRVTGTSDEAEVLDAINSVAPLKLANLPLQGNGCPGRLTPPPASGERSPRGGQGRWRMLKTEIFAMGLLNKVKSRRSCRF